MGNHLKKRWKNRFSTQKSRHFPDDLKEGSIALHDFGRTVINGLPIIVIPYKEGVPLCRWGDASGNRQIVRADRPKNITKRPLTVQQREHRLL